MTEAIRKGIVADVNRCVGTVIRARSRRIRESGLKTLVLLSENVRLHLIKGEMTGFEDGLTHEEARGITGVIAHGMDLTIHLLGPPSSPN